MRLALAGQQQPVVLGGGVVVDVPTPWLGLFGGAQRLRIVADQVRLVGRRLQFPVGQLSGIAEHPQPAVRAIDPADMHTVSDHRARRDLDDRVEESLKRGDRGHPHSEPRQRRDGRGFSFRAVVSSLSHTSPPVFSRAHSEHAKCRPTQPPNLANALN